ncbi:cytotoxin [Labedella gwakjiensis]|uniref:Cytotoxin n=1 Tax=Labedella gwakjiensis TaxID=390269 RepID=A0ABY0C4F4_9MICO|nr:cytotoxin [Labedella gwakjiensis]RUQ81840.1 cytotoxin [Labedella gwakjiensis]
MPANFKRRYKKKTEEMRSAIDECILRLVENPRHPGLQTHKMKGVDGVWEAYIDKANRITFHWDKGTIVLRNNCNHDMLYRNP